jgi:MoaA/NifB/PqqE/SkfB family radical SAM enzyme
MIAYQDIRDVHLEIATLCNAICPWCPRNFFGYPYNSGYPELYLTFDNAKKIFQPKFLKQLSSIGINGNYGDIAMNPEAIHIVEYFRNHNNDMDIIINSNGGARDVRWWRQFARLNCEVHFALDGLEDTHSLYRQNTLWKTVIKNAQAFIQEGGNAVWQMIKFKHNEHQIEECKQLSKQMGFANFDLIDAGRDTAPVFDRNGKLSHILGDYTGETDFDKLFTSKTQADILLEDILLGRTPSNNLTCETVKRKSIYIAANGDVSPCCYMGFYPETYGKGQYHQAANAQILPLIMENNAVEYSIEHCIKWFASVEKRWQEKSYENGRLVICDDNCGSCQIEKVIT